MNNKVKILMKNNNLIKLMNLKKTKIKLDLLLHRLKEFHQNIQLLKEDIFKIS